MEVPAPSGLVTLLTDFGQADPYVGVMKGVIKQRHARAEIIDLSHAVPAHDVAIGSLFLTAAIGRFPSGTVHVAVVDPGVGSERPTLAVCAHGCFWIGPDNGLLSAVIATDTDAELRRLDLAALQLRSPCRTFWGRDVFAPAAALLSGRRYGFRALGPRAGDVVRLDSPPPSAARVLAVDRFGNLITSLKAAFVAAESVAAVEVGGQRVTVRETYSEVEVGATVALINSYDLLEVAVREGSAADLLGVGAGDPITCYKETSE